MVDQRIVDHMQQVVAEHHRSLGRVAVAWASFEHEIASAIWELAGIDIQAGACLTAQILGAGRLLDSYVALAKLRNAPKSTISKLHEFQQKTYTLSERRNRLIHDSWAFDPPGGSRFEISARGKLSFELKPDPTSAIDTSAVAIEHHAEIFVAIAREIQSATKIAPLPAHD